MPRFIQPIINIVLLILAKQCINLLLPFSTFIQHSFSVMTICYYTEITHQWNAIEIADKLAVLPEKLQQAASRKMQWMDKQLSIAGKLLLKKTLNEFDKKLSLADLKHDDYHRPYIDSSIDFNITHSGNIVLCCTTDTGKIGVDIEEIKVLNLDEYAEYFTHREWDTINNYPNKHDGFYDFWTRKEAVLKAIGTGLHTPLLAIDVVADKIIYEENNYYLQPLNIKEGYKSHIATTAMVDNIKPQRINL